MKRSYNQGQNYTLLRVQYTSGRVETIRCSDPLEAKQTKEKLDKILTVKSAEFIRL